MCTMVASPYSHFSIVVVHLSDRAFRDPKGILKPLVSKEEISSEIWGVGRRG